MAVFDEVNVLDQHIEIYWSFLTESTKNTLKFQDYNVKMRIIIE